MRQRFEVGQTNHPFSLSHWSGIKRNSHPNPPRATPAHFAAHYLRCSSVSTMQSGRLLSPGPPIFKGGKNLLCKMYSFSKSPERREDWDDGNALWDSDLRPDSAEVSCVVPFCSLIKCQCQVVRRMICSYWALFIKLVWNWCRCGCEEGKCGCQ